MAERFPIEAVLAYKFGGVRRLGMSGRVRDGLIVRALRREADLSLDDFRGLYENNLRTEVMELCHLNSTAFERAITLAGARRKRSMTVDPVDAARVLGVRAQVDPPPRKRRTRRYLLPLWAVWALLALLLADGAAHVIAAF